MIILYGEIELFFILFFLIIVVISIILLLDSYKKYVVKTSIALKRMNELNLKYNFHLIPSYNMEHSYDNEKMYNEISPKDYLIYELQFKKKQVRQALLDAKNNSENYKKYIEEIEKISIPTKSVKIQFLFNWFEKSLFEKSKKTPITHFTIHVVLFLTNINGERKKRKSKLFVANEIYDILYTLNKKNGDYYLVPEIWQSICRVERGKVTNKIRFAIFNRDNYCCRKCGRRTDDLEIDHIYPIAKGGKSTIDNLQTLCHRCNVKKGANIE